MADKVVVVGLGRFGTVLSGALVKSGYDVLAVDRRPDRVKEFASDSVRAVEGDATSKALWDDLEPRGFQVGVVAFSSDMGASILACLMLKRMGVHRVIAKSSSDLHSAVLAAIGVDEVIEPEQEAGRRMSHVLGAGINEYLELAEEYGVAKVGSPPLLIGRTCAEAEHKHGATVLVIRRADKVILTPSSTEEIKEGDVLVLAAKDATLRRMGMEAAQRPAWAR